MDYIFLSKIVLFKGMTPKDVESLLNCMKAQVKGYSLKRYLTVNDLPSKILAFQTAENRIK